MSKVVYYEYLPPEAIKTSFDSDIALYASKFVVKLGGL